MWLYFYDFLLHHFICDGMQSVRLAGLKYLAGLEWNDKNVAGASQSQPSKKFCDEMVS